MKFETLNIIGGGPNCVYAIEILLKKILKYKDQIARTLVMMNYHNLTSNLGHN